jgi:predicted glycogen debranching enzyme
MAMLKLPAAPPTDGSGQSRLDDLLTREWLTVNHLGGYASSTVPSLNTRKYHGLLVAPMTPPLRRLVLLSRVEEVVHCDGWPVPLACNEYPGTIHPDGWQSLRAFSAEPFPRWAYQAHEWSLEKSLQLLRGQNTVVLTYTLLGACKPLELELELRPLLALRPIHDLTYQWGGKLDAEEKPPLSGHYRVPPTSRTPEVFFAHRGTFDASGAAWYFNTIYRCEQERGYAGLEDLWCPGSIRWTLAPGESVQFVCSADPIDFAKAVEQAEAECARLDAPIVSLPSPARATRDTDHDLLVRAAEKFVIDVPSSAAPAMITKFHWASPSAREALIALPGVLLVTGKFAAAKAMLLSLARQARKGMIPTEFPEDGSAPRYTGADTTLWFVNAVHQYLRYTAGDEKSNQKLVDTVLQIVRAYRRGAELGIKADGDGLLVTRWPGVGTTWMDAKVGDWVVTPRAGRPVELNALWYNAVRIAADLAGRFGQTGKAKELNELADEIRTAFNARFWNEREGCCYDVVDDHGLDPSIRPNQLLAVSLPFAVLMPRRHSALLQRVCDDLITPMGLRTLSPRDSGYHGRYGGDVLARDGAYHHGPIHTWLLGSLVSAHVRVHGRGDQARREARAILRGVLEHLRTDGLGQVRELFDGDAPHAPGAALASAAATGELLRCYVEDILDLSPDRAAPTAAPAAQLDVTINPKVASKR